MTEAPKLTHFEDGRPVMVDVTGKQATAREALAEGFVVLPPEAARALESGGVGKGDALAVAQLAGIMGAKRTADLIPLCHPIPLGSVRVALTRLPDRVRVEARVKTTSETGVEMEALTAVSVACLTLYDMLKASSKAIEVTGIRLLEKSGGKSGDYRATAAP
ncbi:MAG TPA: cyclic pyranopterin monophosphate synthase MoaC [Deinococcales bacterium]|nr:cyclic pyranopterin monophosphate synthase MoaC [Deinococcales bacterium]